MAQEKTALFLGRFQPPHRGHEKAMGWMLKRHAKLRVAIGSSNRKREAENPFSAKERAVLLKKIIASHVGWKGRVSFSLVPDFELHGKWVEAMLAKFPAGKFEFYTNNELVRKLFAAKGFVVHPNPQFRRMEMEGRKIRDLARNGKDISARLPKAIQKQAKGLAAIISQ